MFGIFTHAQLHPARFWDILSQQLQRWGPEYIERCTFQNKPLNTGDNVILPGTFPPFPYQVQDIPQTAPLDKISEEDMKAVSNLARVPTTITEYMYNRSILCLCTLFLNIAIPLTTHV
jgi:hypothetical protein